MGKKKRSRQKRRNRTLWWGIGTIVFLVLTILISGGPFRMVCGGFVAGCLFLAVNTWFRFLRKKAGYAVAALLVIASVVVMCASFTAIQGHMFATNVTSLSAEDLTGVTDLSGIGRLKKLRVLDANGLGITDAGELYQCSSLESADLRGNSIPAAQLLELARSLPRCRFVWDVPLSRGVYSYDAEQITLTGAEVSTADDVKGYLSLFTSPKQVTLEGVALTAEEKKSLDDAYPNALIVCDVKVGERTVGAQDSALTLDAWTEPDEILSLLNGMPNVASLDVQSAEYDVADLMRITAAYPDLDLVWKSADVSSQTTSLDLTGKAQDADTVLWLVDHMPSLTKLTLGETQLDGGTLRTLAQAHPDLELDWDLHVGDMTVKGGTDSLDLSGRDVTYEDVLSCAMSMPKLLRLDVTGTPLTEEEKRSLADALPGTCVVWEMDFFGTKVSTDIDKIKTKDLVIGSKEDLATALRYLPKLTYVDLTDCTLSNEDLAEVRGMYPEKGVVWTVHIGIYSVRTNATAFSTFHHGGEPCYNSREFSVLRYCDQLLGLDIGHNHVDNLEWLEDMTQLKVLILVDNKITDISSLAKLTNLEYLELFVNYVTDVTPLVGLDKLMDLNLGYCNITNIEPLTQMTWLQRLWMTNNYVSYADQKRLTQALPNTVVDWTAKESVDNGWRTHPHYAVIHEMFENNYYVDWDGNKLK